MMRVVLTLCAVATFLALSQGQVPAGKKKLPCELQKDVIVQFHGWKYVDIESECKAGQSQYYCAFQVPPPHEHQVYYPGNISFPPNAEFPWWQRWNTISFSLFGTDSGTYLEFWSMITECRANNIKIIVDMEMNNVGDSTSDGYGSAGGFYNGDRYAMQYPHFSGQSWFHMPDEPVPDGCPVENGAIEDLNNRDQIRYCKRKAIPEESLTTPILYLNDLKTGVARDRFVTAMDILINGDGTASQGIAGFRMAHARWVEPADLRYLSDAVADLIGVTGTRPFFMTEVHHDGIINATEYYDFSQVEEHVAGPLLSDIIRNRHATWKLANLTLWGPNMGLLDSWDAIVYVDDPGSQRSWPELKPVDKVVTYRDSRNYIAANAFMLAHSYGLPRILSSYNWSRVLYEGVDINDFMGPARTGNGVGEIERVVVNATGDGCEGEWNCEHRWNSILGLSRFRNLLNQDSIRSTIVKNYWTNGYYHIAFARGNDTTNNRGFFAMNMDPTQDLRASIYSGLKAGTYCNLAHDPAPITCDNTVTVDGSGRAEVSIDAGAPIPFVAITDIYDV